MTHEEKIVCFRQTAKDCDTAALFGRAEEAMEGLLVLNGTGSEPVYVGQPPRWHENPCGVAGYTWTISRLVYMTTLCKAFLLTEKRDYIRKVETDLTDWLNENPAPPIPANYEEACYYHGVHNWRMLEVGFRLIHSFPTILSVLSVYGEDRGLVERLKDSIAEHAERIFAGSILLWPAQDHNHYTQEIVGLLSAAALLPSHPRSRAWADQALSGIEAAAGKQITEDGGQVEGTPHYHSAVMVDLCFALHNAQQLGRCFSEDFVNRLRRGLDFSVHTLCPNGEMFAVGDTDPLEANALRAVQMGYLLLDSPLGFDTMRRFISPWRIRQELFDHYPWGFPHIPELLARLQSPFTGKRLPLTACQRQLDQFITRSSWEREAACLFFSCHSPIHHGNHPHMEQLGVIFGAYGKILIQDPGRFTYKDCEDRHLFKSSRFHSVPTVDGNDAFEYVSTFVYGTQQPGSVIHVMETDRLRGATGRHENYAPVILTRSAALLDGEVLLVADTYENGKGKNLRTFFHLNSTKVERTDEGLVTRDDDVNLQLCASLPAPELLSGRISDIFYHDYPSIRAVYSCTAGSDSGTTVYVAAAFRKGDDPPLKKVRFCNNEISFAYREKNYLVRFFDGIFGV